MIETTVYSTDLYRIARAALDSGKVVFRVYLKSGYKSRTYLGTFPNFDRAKYEGEAATDPAKAGEL